MHDASKRDHLLACEACRSGDPLGFGISMAFQPIVDIGERAVFAYEALVRGHNGEGAAQVLGKVTPANRYRFDQECRTTAISWAAQLGITEKVSINFMPNAVYEPATCIQATLAAARHSNFPVERIMFEVTEAEDITDKGHVTRILSDYDSRGFVTAIDDFGAGYAGLSLLVDFQPDYIKLDMNLIRGIDQDFVRQSVAEGVVRIASDLGIGVIAEGIETLDEYDWVASHGVRLVQGYLLARPAFQSLPSIDWPD